MSNIESYFPSFRCNYFNYIYVYLLNRLYFIRKDFLIVFIQGRIISASNYLLKITNEKIQLIKKDPRHFNIIYQKYFDEIYAYAYYLAGNKHDAEDVTSMAFMRALEKIHTFKGTAKKIRSWIYTITRNIFIDEICRKNKGEVHLELDIFKEEATKVSTQQHKKILYEELIEVINGLEPPIYKEVLLLRYKQNLEIKEISAIVKKKEGNVRTIIHRAMTKLKEQYLESDT
ncbi:sigma-70 family RNA polymerase sigma factor [Candidatus Dojkabacteria bacterium]|nr:sigma-70 family RNA polymerase sigma factor [Candidatus Dojkabacteria bacterium]